MYKKTITYTDYDGNKRTEDFYFNLNKGELLKWVTTGGDYTLDKVLLKLINERNGKKILETIEGLVQASYGEKTLDGRSFVKSQAIWDNFRFTEAYSVLLYELSTDAKKAGEFVNGVIPKELADKVSEEISKNPDGLPEEVKDFVRTNKDA